MPQRLSKSRFTKGWQCTKLLWWSVHEADAVELQPDKVLQDLFDQGRQVGELARTGFPGGALIDHPYRAYAERLASTRAALDADAPAVFEACFEAGGVFVAVDVLERRPDGGWNLIEVKGSSSLKDEHIPDVAIQLWVLRQAGLRVDRVELMLLNKEYRHPGQGELLVRVDVTEAAESLQVRVPEMVEEYLAALHGPLPAREVGLHCYEPRDCPFQTRCWPDDPLHIRHLTGVGPRKTASYLASGVRYIQDIPSATKLNFTQRRQIKALTSGTLLVEPSLAGALAAFESPLGYLDFETVSRAVPVWDGLGPWALAAAQFSYHEELPDGTCSHVGWLAEGPGDPARQLAEAMLDATRNARRIVMYTSFEKARIRDLQKRLPDLHRPLEELIGKLVDLHPVIKDHVYHPDFRGSFSLKDILTPLVPELSYRDLVIVDGRVASVEIARLLFVAHKIPAAERDRLRRDLLDYCERDTWATVRLMARLRELARLT